MLKNLLLIASVTLLLTAACKKEKTNTSENKSKSKAKSSPAAATKLSDKELLQGDWVLEVDICCGRNKRTRQGAELDFTKELIFQDTSVYIHYQKKGEPLQKELHGYKTKTEESSYGSTKYINLGFPNRYGLYSVSKDTLIIDYGYMDLQKEIYLRKKKQ